jgi:hypothetical protein
MKFKAAFQYIVYGEVEVSLPVGASDHDITAAIMGEVVGQENKFDSVFDIDFKNMARTPE